MLGVQLEEDTASKKEATQVKEYLLCLKESPHSCTSARREELLRGREKGGLPAQRLPRGPLQHCSESHECTPAIHCSPMRNPTKRKQETSIVATIKSKNCECLCHSRNTQLQLQLQQIQVEPTVYFPVQQQ